MYENTYNSKGEIEMKTKAKTKNTKGTAKRKTLKKFVIKIMAAAMTSTQKYKLIEGWMSR